MKPIENIPDLRQRITRVLVPALTILVLAGGFVLHSAVKKLLIAQFDHALLTKVRALTSFPERDRVGINLGFTERPFPEFHGGPHAEYFQVWLSDGSILAKSPSLSTNGLPKRVGTDEAPEYWRLRLPDGRMGRAVGLRLNSKKDERETFSVDLVLARDSKELDRVLSGLAAGIALTGGVLLLLAWYGVRAITTSALRPVNQLAQQVAAVDANSLGTQLQVQALPPDLRPIAEQINDLMKRLEAAFHRERRFAANAAHELLTPVSELRIAAENAIDWPDDLDATATLAEEARDLSGQMEHVVRSLLALSRAEAQLMALKVEEVNIGSLIKDVLRSVEPRMAARNLLVKMDLPERLILGTDVVIFRSMLSNLLLNAAEYSREGTEIIVRASKLNEKLEVTVTNETSLPISPQDLESFCEAFWRGDQSHQSREHAGLGLAVTRAFAQVLQGELRLKLEGTHTFIAQASLPSTLSVSSVPRRESGVVGWGGIPETHKVPVS